MVYTRIRGSTCWIPPQVTSRHNCCPFWESTCLPIRACFCIYCVYYSYLLFKIWLGVFVFYSVFVRLTIVTNHNCSPFNVLQVCLYAVADPDLQLRRGGGRRGQSSRPWHKRGARSQKKFFPALRASVWSQNKGGGGDIYILCASFCICCVCLSPFYVSFTSTKRF